MEKKSDTKKRNEDGSKIYTIPKEKPPRHDLRNRGDRPSDDPLDKKDKYKEKEMNRNSSKEAEIAKKIARKRLKAAERKNYSEKGFNVGREGIANYSFKEKGIKSIAKTYKHLADSFYNMAKAVNTFASCKSSEISPDGKLGGKGYIQHIKEIRVGMAECLNTMSELIDTFHDEVNSPYWKKTTVEDHPAVKEILNDADSVIDQAEDLEEKSNVRDPKNVVLSEDEKNKVLDILKTKGHF